MYMMLALHLFFQICNYLKACFFPKCFVLNSTFLIQHTVQWKESIVLRILHAGKLKCALFHRASKSGWELVRCPPAVTFPYTLPLQNPAFAARHCLPTLPSDCSHAQEHSATEIRPGLSQTRQWNAVSSHLWKSWFPWHSRCEKATAKGSEERNPLFDGESSALTPRQDLLFSWATHPLSPGVLRRQKNVHLKM